MSAFQIRTVSVRRRVDESGLIAEIIGLKGGEAFHIFRLRQLLKHVLMLNLKYLFVIYLIQVEGG